jgi:hypothetical protein
LGEAANINPVYVDGENPYKISPKKPFKVYGFIKEEADLIGFFMAREQ